MVRVKQFADDLAISKKQAKNLINKGRNRKDGGSQILENVMADTDKKKKKKKSKNENKKLSPFSRDGKHRTFELTEEMISGRGRMPVIKMEKYNPEDMIGGRGRTPNYSLEDLKEMGIDPRTMSKGGSNVTEVNKDKLSKAQMGQFKNIQNDAVSGKISPAEAQRKIRKMLLLNKKVGGTYSKGADPLKLASPKSRISKAGIDGPSGEKRTSKKPRRDVSDFAQTKKRKAKPVKSFERVANVDNFKEAPKLNKQKAGAEKMLKTVKKAVKRKDGGGFPDLTGDGKVTKKDILKGRGVPGFSRGGGMAIQGLGFKGVR